MDYVDRIPAPTLDSLRLYRDHGILVGGFLTAVLSGSHLMDICGRADEFNGKALPAIAMWVYNELPIESWGTPDRVREWRGRQVEA